MIHYALVAADGRIVQTGRIASTDDLDLQGGPGLQAVACPEPVTDVTHWYDGTSFVELPPKPGDWATFDPATEAWIDARSPEQAAADLATAKAKAIARVNEWAGGERGKHVTQIPGQDMIYLAKEAEALRYLADPDPVDLTGYPLLAAEIGITAETPDQLAQLWVHLGQIWRGLAAGIEAARLGTIKAITEAGDEDGVSAALAQLPDVG